jgi:hypothetical protein
MAKRTAHHLRLNMSATSKLSNGVYIRNAAISGQNTRNATTASINNAIKPILIHFFLIFAHKYNAKLVFKPNQRIYWKILL